MNDPGEGGWLLHGMLISEREEAIRIATEKLEFERLLERAKAEPTRHPAIFLDRVLQDTNLSPEVREILSHWTAPAFFNEGFKLIEVITSMIKGREKRLRNALELPKIYKRDLRKDKARTYLSCWHRKSPANQAMWAAYGLSGAAVAIKTNTEMMRSSLEIFEKQQRSKKWSWSLGEVSYFDQEKRDSTEIINDIMIDYIGDPTATYKFKSDAYEYESEYRAIIKWSGRSRRKDRGLRVPIIDGFIHGVYIDPRSPERHLIRTCISKINSSFGHESVPVVISDIDPAYLDGT